jgi:hypothetical protein
VILIAGNSIGADTLQKMVYIEGNSVNTTDVSLYAGSLYMGIPVFNDTTITRIFPTWTLGCDSAVAANIQVVEVLETFFNYEICEGDFFQGIPIFSDTVIIDTFPLPLGCDSISTSSLQVSPNEEVFLTETIPDGGFYLVGNEVFTQTGQYEVLLETAAGCDSLVHLDLTVEVGTKDKQPKLPIAKAFPNPFSTDVWVEFGLQEAAAVLLTVYDGQGRPVKTFRYPAPFSAGIHRVRLLLPDLPSGIYYIRLQTGDVQQGIRVLKL